MDEGDFTRLERELFAVLQEARRLQRGRKLAEAALLLEGVLRKSPKEFRRAGLFHSPRMQNLVRLIGKAENALGQIANDVGDGRKAMRLFKSARKRFLLVYEVTGDLEDGMLALFTQFNMAVCLEFTAKFRDAERLLRGYLALFDELVSKDKGSWPQDKIDDRRADCLNGLAVVLLGEGRLDEAREYAKEALKIRMQWQQLPEPRWALDKRIMSLQVLAAISLEAESYAEAKGYLERSHVLHKELHRLWGSPAYYSEYWWLLGRLSLMRGKRALAKKYAARATAFAEDDEDRTRAEKLTLIVSGSKDGRVL